MRVRIGVRIRVRIGLGLGLQLVGSSSCGLTCFAKFEVIEMAYSTACRFVMRKGIFRMKSLVGGLATAPAYVSVLQRG